MLRFSSVLLSLGSFASLALVLVSCGGGSGGSGSSAASAGGDGVLAGTVTGFGSFFVNGVEVSSGDSTRFNDGLSREDDLRLGQIVECHARFFAGGRTARATEVRFDEAVEGPVTSVGAGRFEVLGQLVLVDDQTVFERTSVATLAVGNVVEVFGLRDADGAVRATRVELKALSFAPGAGEFIEIEGEVRALAGTTFRIGTLLVDFAAAVLDDLPASGLTNGLFVEVKSDRVPVERSGELVLLATRVEGKDEDFAAPGAGARLEVEGFVTAGPELDVDGTTIFVVGSTQVRVTRSTFFENGTLADVVRNAKVEVEGTVDEDGILVAIEVSLRRASTVRIEAFVEAVAPAGGGATGMMGMLGVTVTLLGLEVAITHMALVEDQSEEDDDFFAPSSVRVGDFLEVRGFEGPDAVIRANRVEREDAEDEVLLRGPAVVNGGGRLSILGVEIVLSGATEFEGEGDEAISQEEFFRRLAAGGFAVEATGVYSGDGRIFAEEVELEG